MNIMKTVRLIILILIISALCLPLFCCNGAAEEGLDDPLFGEDAADNISSISFVEGIYQGSTAGADIMPLLKKFRAIGFEETEAPDGADNGMYIDGNTVWLNYKDGKRAEIRKNTDDILRLRIYALNAENEYTIVTETKYYKAKTEGGADKLISAAKGALISESSVDWSLLDTTAGLDDPLFGEASAPNINKISFNGGLAASGLVSGEDIMFLIYQYRAIGFEEINAPEGAYDGPYFGGYAVFLFYNDGRRAEIRKNANDIIRLQTYALNTQNEYTVTETKYYKTKTEDGATKLFVVTEDALVHEIS